jgi:D-glycero-D-manno-heptose 1,7-bisphosphate phosphatase
VSRPAVFLDRDGTLIRDRNYIGKPEQVEILPGVAHALRRLNEAAVPIVVVTNQSGIARGYFTEADYRRVHQRMVTLLDAAGARVDADYMCPHHPDFTGPCDCRKPGTLLFRQAAAEHDLDAARSWYVGDKLRDVLPARELAGHGVLVPSVETEPSDIDAARKDWDVAASLDEVVARAIRSAR